MEGVKDGGCLSQMYIIYILRSSVKAVNLILVLTKIIVCKKCHCPPHLFLKLFSLYKIDACLKFKFQNLPVYTSFYFLLLFSFPVIFL